VGLFSSVIDPLKRLWTTTGADRHTDPLTTHYDKLESYYLNSGVYQAIENEDWQGVAAVRSLRNPANRVVEFYAAKLDTSTWLDEEILTIEASEAAEDEELPDTEGETAEEAPDPIRAALERVWWWSNEEAEGRVAVRQYAWAGDLFRKVSHREDADGNPVAVYVERIDPRHVIDFDKDERGHFTYLRVSVPKARRLPDGDIQRYTQTEIWSKEQQRYRRYEHTDTELGDPVTVLILDVADVGNGEGFTGYDFIPVVHAKFRDIGAPRGLSAFGHALGGIREADRLATKLHEMLFPDVVWALERQAGPDGTDIPPIELEDSTTDTTLLPQGKFWARGYDRVSQENAEDIVTLGKTKKLRLPGGASLKPLVPAINFQAHIDALANQIAEVEKLLPETSYYKLRELELSGVAMRTALMDVYDRYIEAFTSLASATVRLDMMALTIGQVLGLDGFSSAEIGEYGDDGAAWQHRFTPPDPFPETPRDVAQTGLARAQALAEFKDVGGKPYEKALVELAGLTEGEARDEAASATPNTNPLDAILGRPNPLVSPTVTAPGQVAGEEQVNGR
jgi:hypothetical protein